MLTLDRGERHLLQNAIAHLLSPLDGGSIDAWWVPANQSLKALLGADMGSFLVPVDGTPRLLTEGMDAEAARQYPFRMPRLPGFVSLWEQQARLGVWNRARLYGRLRRTYYRSEYYNDYVRPARAHDALGLTIRVGDGSGVGAFAGVLYHHDQLRGPRFGPRGLQLLEIVRPAFAAGIDLYLRLGRIGRSLARLIDATGEAVLLMDSAGRELHRTPELGRLLDREQGDQLLRFMRDTGSRIATSRDVLESFSAASCRYRAGEREYEVRVATSDELLDGRHRAVLVTLTAAPGSTPRLEELRARFNLTRRQAQVALLLAQRKSDREIASELCISPHTAHHHTEAVYLKLGVHSRAEVQARIGGILDRLHS